MKEDKNFIFDRPQKTTLRYFLLRFYSFFLSIGYGMMMPKKRRSVKKEYNVSICAIFKNEAPYLREWIEFNHIVGVDHFYMYNNNSEDDFQTVLAPYISSGIVSLIEWPFNQMQMECYIDCIDRFSQETKWLGFIDIDEFIVPKSTDNVYDFLKPFENNRGAVNIYWKMFGSSGLMERDLRGFVTENFTVCWPKYCDIGKCFYNTLFEFNKKSKHTMQLHHKFWANWRGKDLPPVNVFNHICVGNRNVADRDDFPIQINHYFTKSYKEYAIKKSRGDVYFKNNPHDEEYFYFHEMKCTDTDYSAYKYLIKLKNVLDADNHSDQII